MEQKNHSLFLKSESTECLSYIMIVDTIKNKYTINSKQCPDFKLFIWFFWVQDLESNRLVFESFFLSLQAVWPWEK